MSKVRLTSNSGRLSNKLLIQIIQKDITQEEVDAIVNAANE